MTQLEERAKMNDFWQGFRKQAGFFGDAAELAKKRGKAVDNVSHLADSAAKLVDEIRGAKIHPAKAGAITLGLSALIGLGSTIGRRIGSIGEGPEK